MLTGDTQPEYDTLTNLSRWTSSTANELSRQGPSVAESTGVPWPATSKQRHEYLERTGSVKGTFQQTRFAD